MIFQYKAVRTILMAHFDRYDDNITQQTTINLIVTVTLCLLGCQVKKADS